MTVTGDVTLDDDLIARSIQGFAQGFPQVPNEPSKPVSVNLRHISSIAPAEPQFSPTLMPPKQSIMIRILQTHEETEKLLERKHVNFETASTRALAEIDRLSLEREEAFRKELEAAKNRDSWSTLSVVSQYIASVGAATLGWSLGGIPGFLIGLGGVAGGIARLLNDTHLMEPLVAWFTKSEELQKEIKINIETGAMYLQMGLGLAGGAAAWHAGAFAAMQAANTVDYLTKTAFILSTAGGVMSAGSQVGAAYYNKHRADWNAKERLADLGLFEQRQELTQQTKEIGEILDNQESVEEQIKKMIQKQEVQFDS